MDDNNYFRICGVLFLFCICGISSAGALTIDYIGIDKVDLSWYEVSSEDFVEYQIYRDDSRIATIPIAAETAYRDEGVSEGLHDYKLRVVTSEESYDSSTQTVDVGEPRGQLKCGDETWSDTTVRLSGDVNLGGYTLTITTCDVLATSEYDITGTGDLAIRDSTFDTVTVDATAPYATVEKVTSNRPINVKGGDIEASSVDIPWGSTWGPGDHILSLSGDRNTVTGCNAEIHTQGNFTSIKDCLGTHLKIYATGDNTTIQNNTLYDVRGIAIYAEGNDLRIHSNEVDNATSWDKSYYTTEGGTGIQISDSSRNVDVYDNTITGAEDCGILASASRGTTMADYSLTFNTISECGIGLFATSESSGWLIEENTFSGCTERAMYIQQADLMRICENSFEDLDGSVYVEWSSNSTITHNTFTVRDHEALEVFNGEDDGNITVACNTITGIETGNNGPDGIMLSARDSVVEDNVITNCRRGIDAMDQENITVRDNQITDCWGDWGLYCYELNHGLVENNTLISTSAGGGTYDGVIYVHHTGNATVKNNLIDGGKNGIYIEFAADGVVVEQNTVKNTTSFGVKVYEAKNGDGYHNYRGPANVTTRDNTLISENGYAGYGCYYVYGTSFVNNTVTGHSRGVQLSVANNSVVRDNRFDDIEQGFTVFSAPYSSVENNIFDVTQTGGIVDTGSGSKNTTVADNRISGYESTGIKVNEPEGTILRNNTLCGTDSSWDIYLAIPTDTWQETLVLEKNTVGTAHPTTITITDPDNPVLIRGVESPPEPPSPPDYETTKSAVGNWVEIIGEGGLKKARMNLTFHYTEEQITGVEEKTLSIWKYNGTGWDAGNDLWDAWNGTRWQNLEDHEIGVDVKELCIFAPLGGYPVHNIRVPKDYLTITDALTDSEFFQSGDTITVDDGYSGTKENLFIIDSVTLKSSSGSAAAVTLTASDPYEPTVKVYGDDVEIDGFVITGATGTQGVRFAGAENAKVTNCRIEGNFFGVSICRDSWGEVSSYGKVIDCTITGNEHGAVVINESAECNVIDCTLSGDVGIGILDSESAYVSGNTITNCDDYGIAVDGGRDNEVTDCTVTGGGLGIYLYGGEAQTVTDCTVTDTNAPGVLLEETEGNTISGITVTGAPLGLGCEGADDNVFTGIQVNGGDAGGTRLVGIALDDSDGNTLTGCTVSDLRVVGYSATGVEMTGSSRTNTIETCRFSGFESSRVDGAVFASSGNLLRNCTFTDLRGATAGAAGISTTQNTAGNTVRHCSFDGISAPENATAFAIRDTTDLLITDCTVGTVTPANTSAFAVFENSDYSNVIEETTLGTLAAITSLSAAGNVTASNVTAVPPDGEEVLNIGHYLNLTSDGTGEASVAFAYTDADLGGKNPALLSVWRYDGSAWSKVPAPNGVNTAERYVYAENITEFSVFAPMWSASGLPKANFTAEPIDGDAPLAVQFTDTSRNAESWSWAFGDGATSTEQNPQHTYTSIGRFDVTLTVGNALSTDTMTRERYITVRDIPPEPPEQTENFTLRDNGTSVTDVGGRQQVSFNATAGNGTVVGNDIVLTGGNMNVTIRTDGLSSTGNVSTGNVTGVLLESSPVSTDLGDLGNVSVGFNASMPGYNPDLGITTSIYDRPSDEATTAFTLAAAGDGLSITSTAYAVYFTKTNLTENDTIQDAVLRLTVSPDWVNANGGTDAIRVFRQSDDGDTEALATTYLGLDGDGMMVFEAVSPSGFSAFAVIATKAVTTPVPTSPPSSGGGGGGTTYGGGGPSSVGTITYEQSAVVPATGDGTVTRSIDIAAADGVARLLVPEGVRVLDEAGTAVETIDIVPIAAGDAPVLPAGAAYAFDGSVYDCSPDGATFSPAIELSFALTDEAWNAMIAGGQVPFVAWYDTAAEAWEDVPTTVDAGAKTVTAEITHFSTYALLTREGVLPTATATVAPQTPPAEDAGETGETLSFLYIAIALVAVLIVAGAAFVLMDRRR